MDLRACFKAASETKRRLPTQASLILILKNRQCRRGSLRLKLLCSGGGRRVGVCELTAQACLMGNRAVRDRPSLYRRTDVPYFKLYKFRRAGTARVTSRVRCPFQYETNTRSEFQFIKSESIIQFVDI